MSKCHPTPWRVAEDGIVDADGAYVRGQQARIVRAVNAYESPTAAAERAVVKAAVAFMAVRDDDTALRIQERYDAIDRLRVAVDRLLAVQARAKGKR